MLSDSELVERKRWLRSEYRRRRRVMPQLEKAAECLYAAELVNKVLDTLGGANGWPQVASYLATTEEIDLGMTHAEVWKRGQPLWLPRIQGPGRLQWYPIRDIEQVRIGTLNLCEPDPSLVQPEPMPLNAVILVPGVAFGPDGRRLGMGGGFYDRLLKGYNGISIGVGFANQLCEDLPSEAHDHPVDICILGGDLIHCRAELRPVLGLA